MSVPFVPQELIRKKRDGYQFDIAEIDYLVGAISDHTLTDAQVGALAMGIFLNGLTTVETVAITNAMRDSGEVLTWEDLEGPVVDKHSTGGIGDKLSLLIAPILAVCGAYVPMISGRALGHTGGTLDKLDSIPGYRSQPSSDEFKRVVRQVGCAIVGQTNDLAPADRRLYAIRDITGTVESIPLITSSILSKKLAEGLDALVMDVKFGSGAFMQSLDDARALAQSLVGVANGAGIKCSALLTHMGRCLGRTAGNALEVQEIIDLLCGYSRNDAITEVSMALCAEAIMLTGLADNQQSGRDHSTSALKSGQAAERFAKMVATLGGPVDLIERPKAHLPQALHQFDVKSDRDGFIHEIDARSLGLTVAALGGGRTSAEQSINPAVGLSNVKEPGEKIGRGEPLATIHLTALADRVAFASRLRSAFRIEEHPAPTQPLIVERLGPTCNSRTHLDGRWQSS